MYNHNCSSQFLSTNSTGKSAILSFGSYIRASHIKNNLVPVRSVKKYRKKYIIKHTTVVLKTIFNKTFIHSRCLLDLARTEIIIRSFRHYLVNYRSTESRAFILKLFIIHISGVYATITLIKLLMDFS